MKLQARRHEKFRGRLHERNLVAQIKARDEEVGRWFELRNGKVRSGAGFHNAPDITLAFKDAALGASLLKPPINWLDQINAQKDFKLTVDGPEDLTNWWAQIMMATLTAGWRFGARLADGTMRYCNMTNGGPVFVHVKAGRIVRLDADRFRPIRSAALDYSGAWPRADAAAQDDAGAARAEREIDRVFAGPPASSDEAGRLRSQRQPQPAQSRQVRLCANFLGRGARSRRIRDQAAQEHLWPRRDGGVAWLAPYLGNIGYYLSALHRFRNAVGYTQVHHNPDSWEGWYWGAVHHWGYTLRVGQSETYGTVEDCLQNCDMIVFWAADPETTSGSYGAQEGTIRRQWLKNPRLGIKVVHVDPYYNASAQFLPGKWLAPRPTTSVAMAMAIAYVWIKEDLYDKAYVRTHTVGFDVWKDYLLGVEDGTPKTPEWQEAETGVPAKDVRALAREWGRICSCWRHRCRLSPAAAPGSSSSPHQAHPPTIASWLQARRWSPTNVGRHRAACAGSPRELQRADRVAVGSLQARVNGPSQRRIRESQRRGEGARFQHLRPAAQKSLRSVARPRRRRQSCLG